MNMASQLAPAAGATAHAVSSEAERFTLRQRQARMFAMSPLVPDHLRKGSPEQAMANCYIALTLAEAMGEVPLIVMQNIHVVSGKAGFAAQYMIARANSSGVFKDCIDWTVEGEGKSLKVTAFATLASTGRRIQLSVDMAMAEAEGWTKNAKYRSMPEVMLRYRSAAFLVRFYAPQVMLGYHTIEEVEDVVTAGMEAAAPLTAAALLAQARPDAADVAVINNETGEVLGEERPADTVTPETPHAEEGRADADMSEARNDTAGAGDEPAQEGPAAGEAPVELAAGNASPGTLQERMSALAEEAKAGPVDEPRPGQSDDADGDWPAWLESLEGDMAKIDSVVDVNSAWSLVRKTLEGAPDHIQERAADIKNARISGLKNEQAE
jgi:hypothetical protein